MCAASAFTQPVCEGAGLVGVCRVLRLGALKHDAAVHASTAVLPIFTAPASFLAAAHAGTTFDMDFVGTQQCIVINLARACTCLG